MKIDLRSAVTGAIAGAGLIIVVGAATEPPQQVGKYQVVLEQGEAIVIDTTTGELTKRYRHLIKVGPAQPREQKVEKE